MISIVTLFLWVVIPILTFTNVVSLGVLFIWSVFSFIYHFVLMFQRGTKLTNIGAVYLVLGLIIAIITGLNIFTNYDIVSMLIK